MFLLKKPKLTYQTPPSMVDFPSFPSLCNTAARHSLMLRSSSWYQSNLGPIDHSNVFGSKDSLPIHQVPEFSDPQVEKLKN